MRNLISGTESAIQNVYLSKRHPLYLQYKLLTMSPFERMIKKLIYSIELEQLFESLQQYNTTLTSAILSNPNSIEKIKSRNLHFINRWRKEDFYCEVIQAFLTLTLSTYFFKKEGRELFFEELEDKILNIDEHLMCKKEEENQEIVDIVDQLLEYSQFVLNHFNSNVNFIQQSMHKFEIVRKLFKHMNARVMFLKKMQLIEDLMATHRINRSAIAFRLYPFLVFEDERKSTGSIVKYFNLDEEFLKKFESKYRLILDAISNKKTH